MFDFIGDLFGGGGGGGDQSPPPVQSTNTTTVTSAPNLYNTVDVGGSTTNIDLAIGAPHLAVSVGGTTVGPTVVTTNTNVDLGPVQRLVDVLSQANQGIAHDFNSIVTGQQSALGTLMGRDTAAVESAANSQADTSKAVASIASSVEKLKQGVDAATAQEASTRDEFQTYLGEQSKRQLAFALLTLGATLIIVYARQGGSFNFLGAR